MSDQNTNDTEDIQLVDIEAGYGTSNKVTVAQDDSDVDDIDSSEENKLIIKRQCTEDDHMRLNFGPLQIERYVRLIFSILFLGGALIILWVKKAGNPFRNIAACMALVQSIWFVQFLGVVLTMDHLHSIVVFRKIVPDTRCLVVPYRVKEYKKDIMSSISAMSSMRGSNLFSMLGSSSNIVFGMTFAAVSFKWHDIKEVSPDSFALFLLTISVFGATIISQWELDTTSKLSTWLHYFGALISFGTAPIAFAINQRWSALSIAIICITYACLGIFGSVYAFAKPHYENDPKRVHRVSMFCIIVELVAVVNGMICVILYIYCMDGNRIL